MSIHDLVRTLEAAGIVVPCYRTDTLEWVIDIEITEEQHVLEHAIAVLKAADHTPATVRQDVETGQWSIVLPAGRQTPP